MMIFYLQKCNPPLIPVLQEMHPPEEKPVNMVDGWNAWFFSDRRKVMAEWAGYGRNRQSVGQLWLGFLHFYAGDWDDKRCVVSIRQSKPLTKFEKMWNSPCIAIGDPFELSHNLGAGISRKMNLYIKKAFINGRRLFGTPLTSNPRGYRTVQDYFFDPDLLTDGPPPNDRGCRACGKIGHLVADCPRKKVADNRKRQEKDRRERQNQQESRERQNQQELQRTDDQSAGKRRDRQSQDRVRDRQRTMSEQETEQKRREAAGGFSKAQVKTKIKSLEKWKRKNGKLSEEDQKLLIQLNSLEKKQRVEEKGKRDLEQSELQRRMFEEAVKNVGGDVSTLGNPKALELKEEAEQNKSVEAQPKSTKKKKSPK